jgi:hypothetical protein
MFSHISFDHFQLAHYGWLNDLIDFSENFWSFPREDHMIIENSFSEYIKFPFWIFENKID